MLISVVVPIHRWCASIDQILRLDIPYGHTVEFLLIINGDENLASLVQKVSIKYHSENRLYKLITLNRNVGASVARNVGIDQSRGEIILFLDSDIMPSSSLIERHLIHYLKNPKCIGVLGDVKFISSGQKLIPRAVLFSGFQKSFIAQSGKEVKWGPTANISFLRKAIGHVRFDINFHPEGGGEDVDFGFQITEGNESYILMDEKATCNHPTWDGLRNCIRRFFRWGSAEGILMEKYPNCIHASYPNYFETPTLIFTFYLIFSMIFCNPILLALFIINWPFILLCKFLCEMLIDKAKWSDLILRDFFLFTYDFGTFIGRVKRRNFHSLLLHKFSYEVNQELDIISFNNSMRSIFTFSLVIHMCLISIELVYLL